MTVLMRLTWDAGRGAMAERRLGSEMDVIDAVKKVAWYGKLWLVPWQDELPYLK